MSSWIETELKLLLPNRAAWQRIRAALGPGRVVVQVNHFFDRADGALAAARIAVRLRSEGEGEEGEAQGIGGVHSSDVSGFLETLGSICRGVHLARNAGFTNRRERLRVELRDEEGAFEIELDLDDLAAIEVTPAPSKLERLRALPRSSP